jgi:hypothetical protein
MKHRSIIETSATLGIGDCHVDGLQSLSIRIV